VTATAVCIWSFSQTPTLCIVPELTSELRKRSRNEVKLLKGFELESNSANAIQMPAKFQLNRIFARNVIIYKYSKKRKLYYFFIIIILAIKNHTLYSRSLP